MMALKSGRLYGPLVLVGALLATHHSLAAPTTPPSSLVVEGMLEIAEVPADFRVGLSLLTAVDRQYVAFYDRERRMTVASRTLGSGQWQFKTLPSKVGWDSHNYVTMALDAHGHLHVSGNMHVNPLVYFRTSVAGDISTLEPAGMTGQAEDRVTYPRFLTDHQERLIFTYRDGGSGNGVNYYNVYDPENRTWTRLFDQPLFDGEGLRNAYPSRQVQCADGWFHMTWVWRDTPCCSTNQHLSYARSRDLIHWESAFGDQIDLPIQFHHEELLVDAVPSGGGIINGGQRLYLDSENRPLVSYHKSDQDGNMQVYAARPEDGRWRTVTLTDWNEPVEFSGGGSMGFIGIGISEFAEAKPGVLTMTWQHRDHGHGRLFVDERTLQPLDMEFVVVPELPSELDMLQRDFPGLEIRRAYDSAPAATAAGPRYLLQWESLGANRDRAPAPPLPEPGMLRLIKLTERAEDS